MRRVRVNVSNEPRAAVTGFEQDRRARGLHFCVLGSASATGTERFECLGGDVHCLIGDQVVSSDLHDARPVDSAGWKSRRNGQRRSRSAGCLELPDAVKDRSREPVTWKNRATCRIGPHAQALMDATGVITSIANREARSRSFWWPFEPRLAGGWTEESKSPCSLTSGQASDRREALWIDPPSRSTHLRQFGSEPPTTPNGAARRSNVVGLRPSLRRGAA